MWLGYFFIRMDTNFNFLQLTTNIYHTNSNQTCLTLITYNHSYDSTYRILIFLKESVYEVSKVREEERSEDGEDLSKQGYYLFREG